MFSGRAPSRVVSMSLVTEKLSRGPGIASPNCVLYRRPKPERITVLFETRYARPIRGATLFQSMVIVLLAVDEPTVASRILLIATALALAAGPLVLRAFQGMANGRRVSGEVQIGVSDLAERFEAARWLGRDKTIERIEVSWPGGEKGSVSGGDANRIIQAKQGGGRPAGGSATGASKGR